MIGICKLHAGNAVTVTNYFANWKLGILDLGLRIIQTWLSWCGSYMKYISYYNNRYI